MSSLPDPKLRALFFDAFAARPRPEAAQILREPEHHEGARLREFLAPRTAAELMASELGSELEGKLWLLAPEAFRYFLPAFLSAALESYATLGEFVSELLHALTEPSRGEIETAFERTAHIPRGLGLPEGMTELLRKQQLEWFDSGTPAAAFHDWADDLTAAEGAAVLTFFGALKQAHGADFPFDQLSTAVDRYWGRFRAPEEPTPPR